MIDASEIFHAQSDLCHYKADSSQTLTMDHQARGGQRRQLNPHDAPRACIRSAHFEDVVQRTVGETASDAYGDDPVHPVVRRSARLEERDGAEVVAGEVNGFAAVQPLQDAICPSMPALVGLAGSEPSASERQTV